MSVLPAPCLHTEREVKMLTGIRVSLWAVGLLQQIFSLDLLDYTPPAPQFGHTDSALRLQLALLLRILFAPRHHSSAVAVP